MQDGVLAKRIFELKESEKGVEYMCKEMEEIRSEGIAVGLEVGRVEGRMEGKVEAQREMAKRLLDLGMPLEQIAQAVQVSVQMLQEWLSGETSPVK